MNPYFKKLQSELAWQEDTSVLELLYWCYRDLHPQDSEAITARFSHLNDILGKLPLKECDAVWDQICGLCIEHEQEGFFEGLRTGVALAVEIIK